MCSSKLKYIFAKKSTYMIKMEKKDDIYYT